MANVDGAFGFRQVGGLGSRPTSEGTSKYVIQSGTTGAIYAGDVMTAGNGTTVSEGGGVLAYGYVGSSETDAVRNVGIFNGCFYDDPTTSKPTFKNYWPGDVATTSPAAGATAFVYDNPFQIYRCGTDAQVASTIAGAHEVIFQTFGFNTTAGSTATGKSSATLDIASTHATDDTWKFLGVAEDPENSDVTAAYCSVNVIQNLNEIVDST